MGFKWIAQFVSKLEDLSSDPGLILRPAFETDEVKLIMVNANKHWLSSVGRTPDGEDLPAYLGGDKGGSNDTGFDTMTDTGNWSLNDTGEHFDSFDLEADETGFDIFATNKQQEIAESLIARGGPELEKIYGISPEYIDQILANPEMKQTIIEAIKFEFIKYMN